MSLKLLFVQLNEINFDIVEKYLLGSKKGRFKNFRILKNHFNFFNTFAEDKYENLEPWIQWTSVNLGKNFDQHKIFRLGDIVNFPEEKQIFEKIENRGFKVGAISPMNASNRLKNPCYFIPDPWTDTCSDGSAFSERITSMLRQTVNDNASGKLSIKSVYTIIEIILRTLNFKNTLFLMKLIFSTFFKPWKKSLVLDYLTHLLHIYLIKKKKPNFSSIFLNAGAHIQHHYLHNSNHLKNLTKNPKWYLDPSSDPIEDMLEVYDQIIGDYIKLSNNKSQLLISTGLRQVPYEVKKFYYRLKNHSSFLINIGVKFSKVLPRMTRDFEVIFDNEDNKKEARKILEQIKTKKNHLYIFKEIEERKNSLFVTLTYPNEVKKNDKLIINDNFEINFFDELVFVAIKNGKHDTKGYVFHSLNSDIYFPKETTHISKLHDIIMSSY